MNLNQNNTATESALQAAIELKVDLVLVQEPWVLQLDDYTGTRSISHTSFVQILSKHYKLRPRTLAYVSKSFKPLVSLATNSPKDSNLLVLDIIEGNSKIQLYNIYNEAD